MYQVLIKNESTRLRRALRKPLISVSIEATLETADITISTDGLPTSSTTGKMSPHGLEISLNDKDDESYHSSVISFDSREFSDDEQYDHDNSKVHCSISMLNTTAIHVKNKDDIAEEASAGTFSSMADDYYIKCMPFDFLSLVPERMSYPQEIYCKVEEWKDELNIDMSEHEYFTNGQTLDEPSYQQQLSADCSQLTDELPLISLAESACSNYSFSSESVKYMVDILKEETERRKCNMNERIAKIRDSADKELYKCIRVIAVDREAEDENNMLT